MTSHYTNVFYFIITHRFIYTCILKHSFKCYGRCLMVQKPLKSLIGHLLFRIKCYFRLRILRSQVKQHMWPTKRYIELLASTLMCLDISWGISLCYKLLSKLCWSPAQIMFPEKKSFYIPKFLWKHLSIVKKVSGCINFLWFNNTLTFHLKLFYWHEESFFK